MKSDVEQAVRDVVRRFEEAFAKEREELAKIDHAWRGKLESQAFMLGPMSVLRAARSERRFERLANRGFANIESLEEPGGGCGALTIMTSQLGSAVASVLGAIGASVANVQVTLAASVHTDLREVLAPLVARDVIALLSDGSKTQHAKLRSAAFVAPFYYAKHDIERLVTHLCLEAAIPCPLAEGGVELFVSSRWDQRWPLLEKLRAARSSLVDLGIDVRAVDVTIVDVEDTLSLLSEVELATTVRPFSALSAFVYPMIEESADIHAALTKTLTSSPITIKNGRPSFGFWAHQGRPCHVDVPQILRAAPPASWCERRCDFERTPSLRAAASSAIRNAIPSALLP